MRMTNICLSLLLCTLVLGCSMGSKVQLSNDARASLGGQKQIYGSSTSGDRVAKQPESGQQCVDYAAETEVSEQSVKAWRVALAGNAPQGMKMLEDLDKKYPNMKTVSLMKGQIQEHAGNFELAAKYYKAANVGDEFDSMKLFKLAEMERRAGKDSYAITDYRKLLSSAPDFAPAELGLAKTYLKGDAKSSDAKKCLQQVLEADPDGKDKSTVEAKKLLQQFDSNK